MDKKKIYTTYSLWKIKQKLQLYADKKPHNTGYAVYPFEH